MKFITSLLFVFSFLLVFGGKPVAIAGGIEGEKVENWESNSSINLLLEQTGNQNLVKIVSNGTTHNLAYLDPDMNGKAIYSNFNFIDANSSEIGEVLQVVENANFRKANNTVAYNKKFTIVKTNTGLIRVVDGVVNKAGSVFKVGDNIGGFLINRIKNGTNGKVAVIGRRMLGHVEEVGSYLQNQGSSVELFNAFYQNKSGITFEIEGGIYEWTDILDDFNNPSKYLRNESNRIVDSDLRNTLMYKANQIWANKLLNEGYTIIDIGYPANFTDGTSVFYNMELQTIFGQ